MKFIPNRIKRIFSRKSRKAEAETPAPAVAEAAPAPEPVKPKEPDPRLKRLDTVRTPEGNYLLDLDVAVMEKKDGQYAHIIANRETSFHLVLMGPQFLSGVKKVATEVEDHLNKFYGLEAGHIYYKRRDANFHFDGADERLGLPPGNGFQILFVPEGSNWRPEYSPPPARAIPNTGTVLQHPATLLPQFAPQVNVPIMFVNGLDVLTPQLPAMPKTTQIEKKPEEPAQEPVAQPAAAPPPPSPPKP
jgi:hypothetical protein